MKKVNRSNYKPTKGRKVKGQSMTVPNETVSIGELLRRHTSGGSLSGKAGVYVEDADENDQDAEKFMHLDPTEKEDILEGMRAMTARLRQLEKEYKAAKEGPPKEPEKAS